ncbi:phage head closure protein [Staphylococcus haemolyticus]|uniref:phage head closure protein n=1 Tax=Staphylococcus haemolyticus TaxID=1283 RepID=UPI002DBB97E7|nr:phage head closure protein [Staphylococcus haemolyticus]MEB6260827.1 phage head closure protein [Staphylococcus haemolyticus]
MAYHFNNRIEIIEEREDPNAFMPGEGMIITVIAKPWAEVKTLKGSEYADAGFTINEEPMRFIIRYRKGIETYHHVRYKGENYNIQSVTNDNGSNQTLTIFAKKYK